MVLTGCTLECNNIRLHISCNQATFRARAVHSTPRQRKPPSGRVVLYCTRSPASSLGLKLGPLASRHVSREALRRASSNSGTSGEGASRRSCIPVGPRIHGGSGWRGLSFEPNKNPSPGHRERAVAVGARFMSSRSAVVGAGLLNSLGGRTVLSPGIGSLNRWTGTSSDG